MEYSIILCNDVWQYIMSFLCIIDQLSIMQTCQELYNNLYIYNFDDFHDSYEISHKIRRSFNNDILKQRKFHKIKSLIIRYNQDEIPASIYRELGEIKKYINLQQNFNLKYLEKLIITHNLTISDSVFRNMINLKTLDISGCHKVRDINCLIKLEELNISYLLNIHNYGIFKLNPKKIVMRCAINITNISYMTNLKYIDISYTSIDNDGIKNLDPIYLDMRNNEKINDLNHMINLEYLDISESYVTNDGIKSLNLIHLKISRNINQFNQMSKLKHLTINGTFGSKTLYELNDRILENLDLESLEIYRYNNCTITNLNHMKNLKKLVLHNVCSLTDEGIRDLLNIEHLDLSKCEMISDINHLTKIKILYLQTCCNINNDSIKHVNPEILVLSNIKNITDINHINNVKYLTLFHSEINDEGVRHINPQKIYLYRCRINNISHFTNLKELEVINEMEYVKYYSDFQNHYNNSRKEEQVSH